jgi:hypothetical protein
MGILYQKFHEAYSPQRYDHSDVWADNPSARVGDRDYPSLLSRSYSDDQEEAVVAANCIPGMPTRPTSSILICVPGYGRMRTISGH